MLNEVTKLAKFHFAHFIILRTPKFSVTQSSHVCRRFVAELKLCDEFARAMLPDVKPKILVVDDEPEAVELVEFNLKQAGYAVTTAADGAEALKKARVANRPT